MTVAAPSLVVAPLTPVSAAGTSASPFSSTTKVSHDNNNNNKNVANASPTTPTSAIAENADTIHSISSTATSTTATSNSSKVQFHTQFHTSPKLKKWGLVKQHISTLFPPLAKTPIHVWNQKGVPKEWDAMYKVAVKGAFNLLLSLSEPEEINAHYIAEINDKAFQPLPSKGVMTVESFKPSQIAIDFLKKDHLQQNLEKKMDLQWPDVADDISRDIQGEWVSAYRGRVDDSKVVFQLHGGCYVLGSAALYRRMAYFISKSSHAKVYSIDYSLAPLYPFPCAVIDALSGYLHLLKTHKAEDIIFCGDSAGGGLALATLMIIRDMGLPAPSGAYLMSPWVDLKLSFNSFFSQHGVDILPEIPTDTRLGDRLHYYAANEQLENPYVSPLYGNFKALPPLFIQCGTIEKLVDEVHALSEKIEGPVIFETYQSHVHVFQQLRPVSKGAAVAINRAGLWMQSLWKGEAVVERVKNELDFWGKPISNKQL